MGDLDLLLDGDHLGGLASFDLSRLERISSLVRVLEVERRNMVKIKNIQKFVTIPLKIYPETKNKINASHGFTQNIFQLVFAF